MLPYSIIRDDDGKIIEVETTLSGKMLLNIPKLNKGCAFTYAERVSLGLLGTLPNCVETLEEQTERAYRQFQKKNTDLAGNIYLNNLHDQNETLFYKLVGDHLEEMMPIIYTPTIGQAVEQYSHENRKPRGFFIPYSEMENIGNILDNRNNQEVDLIVVTDGEGVLGIGDQGVGGIHICIGKLNLYTLCAGVNPNRVLPIQLDLGTNNEALLNDPMYLGWRHKRIEGDEYDAFIDKFVSAVKERFPHIFLHWEDFGRDNARRNLNRYKDSMCTFNDDIQGTGAVALAAILAGISASEIPLDQHRFVIFGAGTAGVGIADQVCQYMIAKGIDEQAAHDAFHLIDRDGLLTDASNNIMSFHKPYLRDSKKNTGINTLEEVSKHVKPTVLIGCSTVTGAFTETIVKQIANDVEHPLIFPLSNPTRKAEATPEDLLKWTDGRALIATGSPFPPADFNGNKIRISQCNNAFIFPGLGLGIMAAKATRLTNAMIQASCEVLVSVSPAQDDKTAPLLPEISNIKSVSRKIALAVAQQARVDGVSDLDPALNLETEIESHTWEPKYFPYKKVDKITHE